MPWSARRTEDAYVRRTIVHQPDEVFAVSGRAEAIAVREPHAVRIVPRKDEVGVDRAVSRVSQRYCAPGHRQLPCDDGLVGVDANVNARPGGSVDVAPILLVPWWQATERRISVLKVNTLNTRRKKGGHGVLVRPGTAGSDLVSEVSVDRLERELEGIPDPGHRNRPLFVTRGDDQLRRKAVQILAARVHPCTHSQRLAGDDPRSAGHDFHGDRVRKESQARRFDGTGE